MAVVQISWRDNSDNETAFKIYQGSTSPLSSGSTQIGTVTLSGGSWSATEFSSGSAPDIQVTSTNTGDSQTEGETFVITYTEGTSGSYYYGISASNAIGDSDVVTTASALTVQ